MADTNNTKLFADFPPISTEEWMAKITKDLKGASFEKKLVWRTNEGFNVQPFYRQEDLEGVKYLDSNPGEFPFVRGNKKDNNAWYVRQDILVEDVKEANAKALDILNKGVDSLGFVICNEELISAENLATLLNDICLEAIEVNFDLAHGSKKFVELFVEYLKGKNTNLNAIKGSLSYDPFGGLLLKGKFCKDEQAAVQLGSELIEAVKEVPNFDVVAVNGQNFSNAGAYIAQELGFALAQGNEYLAKLTEVGVSAYQAATRIKFNLGVSSNYFMEMAKFRAARLLWSQIVEQYKPACECGPECECGGKCEGDFCTCAAKMNIHAVTSDFNMSLYDPYVNMLRTQTEAMSASLAGVDSLTVNPFDKAFKKSDVFSERIARNQQLLLKEESHFEKIVDPSAGSYYIENLTNAIAEQAWSLFMQIEEKGGFIAAAREGFIQSQINESAAKRSKAIATRREKMLGTNEFPNFTEKVADAIQKEAHSCCSSEGEIDTIKFYRAGAEFEALRLATERAEKTPKAFMLTYGNLAMRTARSQFACNFLACAGYKVVDNLGFDTIEAGVQAAMEAKADIVVLCSSDDEYVDIAPKAHELLKDKAIMIVAGAPACMDDLKAAGIEHFINVRSNVLEELKGFNTALGIA